MASQFAPVRGVAFDLDFTLYKNDGTIIANPGTITKKVGKDGADYADIAGAVTEVNTTLGLCRVQLSATEMTADRVAVYIKDDTTGCVATTLVIHTTTLVNSSGNFTGSVASVAADTAAAGYVRITQATLGTDGVAMGDLLAGTVMNAYAVEDTTYGTSLADPDHPSSTADVNGHWFLDVPDADELVVVGRYPNKTTVHMEVST